MVQVLDNFDYIGCDKNGEFFNFKLGDFVKGLRNMQKIVIKPLEKIISF